MIPVEQLPGLKPLPDQVKRKISFNKRLKKPLVSINLSWRKRRYAEYPSTFRKSGMNIGPKNYRHP